MEQKIAQLNEKEILKLLKTSRGGLTAREAQARLAAEGKNQLTARSRTTWEIFLRQVRSPLLYLLLGASLISLILGELVDTITISVILLINVTLGFVQEYRSEKALEKLKSFVTSSVTVIREGEKRRISRQDLVTGDLVHLSPGDIVPADLRLVEVTQVAINESVLTGEVYPQMKITQLVVSKKEISSTLAFAGTTVVGGSALGVVFAKGRQSRMGQITRLTAETERKSNFEENTARFSNFILKVVLITLTLVFLANLFIKGGSTSPVELLLFSIALAVSVIPEALPIVTTITLSQGALALAKEKVVVKRLSAIEDLGHIEVLCSDKTGTITENKLAVEEIYPDDSQECLKFALMATETEVSRGHPSSNSFDDALQKYADKAGTVFKQTVVVKQLIPFDPKRKRVTTVAQVGEKLWLISKGAPEEILKRCRLSQTQKKLFEEKYSSWGEKGYRTLAVARKEVGKKTKYTDKDEELLQILGLIAYSDPLKASAKEAISLAEKLNVRVKILTGDSGRVAGAIAYQVGIIDSPHEFVEGQQIEKLSEKELAETVEKYDVFARVTPEQKFQIIKAIQAKYAVGFLGEGINDAPALKLANAALVVDHASDVAKEAADIILLQKDLDVVVDGIRRGREIFTNIDKYIKYTLVGNFGNFYAIAALSLVIPFLPMLPIQILLSNLLTDLPLISVSADRVDLEEISAPKKFNMRELALLAIILGLTSSFFDFIFFAIFHSLPAAHLQTLWFASSVLTELVLIFSIRTTKAFWRAVPPRAILVILVLLAGAMTIGLPFSSFGVNFFHFSAPVWPQLRIVLFLTGIYFVVTEVVKLAYYRYNSRH